MSAPLVVTRYKAPACGHLWTRKQPGKPPRRQVLTCPGCGKRRVFWPLWKPLTGDYA